MKKGMHLWGLLCLLTLSGCGTMAAGLKTNPLACRPKGSQSQGFNLPDNLLSLSGAQVERHKQGVSITLPSDLLFQPNADSVRLSNKTDIDYLANAGRKYPHVRIEVDVYTDCSHSEEQDLALSELEVWLIKRALVDSGVSADRISAQGWGESRPIATNATDDGRKANRRVTITFGRKA